MGSTHRGPRLASWLFAAVALVGCSSSSARGSRPPAATKTSTTLGTKTVAARPPALACPTHPPQPVSSHQIPGTATTFIPGDPRELLACRYHGFNQANPVSTLAKSARFAPGPFAVALNGARRVPKTAAYNCPADTGETVVLFFGYGDGTKLSATVSTSGCMFANNGDLTVWIPTTTVRQLETMLGRDRL